jgi:hypothetical protein
MSAEKYHKRQIATDQLKTAIWLFLHGRDPASVITLAGAASAITSSFTMKGKRRLLILHEMCTTLSAVAWCRGPNISVISTIRLE